MGLEVGAESYRVAQALVRILHSHLDTQAPPLPLHGAGEHLVEALHVLRWVGLAVLGVNALLFEEKEYTLN